MSVASVRQSLAVSGCAVGVVAQAVTETLPALLAAGRMVMETVALAPGG